MRHNALRDLNAELQKEVCRDVVTEPRLLPLDGEVVTGTSAERAVQHLTYPHVVFGVRLSARSLMCA